MGQTNGMEYLMPKIDSSASSVKSSSQISLCLKIRILYKKLRLNQNLIWRYLHPSPHHGQEIAAADPPVLIQVQLVKHLDSISIFSGPLSG